jgi:hypothetical protein
MLEDQPREFLFLNESYELRFVGEEKCEIRGEDAVLCDVTKREAVCVNGVTIEM